ncbi:MAG: ferritin [Desulfuromonadaceae bacterium]|nr:ferritin [Desulfuromonadaceae bacterium]
MPQEMRHQEAIRIAVEREKDLMCFYQKAAEMVTAGGGQEVFARLAKEKEEHVGFFFRHYRGKEFGTLEEFVKAPSPSIKQIDKELKGVIDAQMHERTAREIAMKKEEQLEKSLRSTAKQIVDPGVRTIFDQMAQATRNHYEIIESEYARKMGMPHETDIDTYVRE